MKTYEYTVTLITGYMIHGIIHAVNQQDAWTQVFTSDTLEPYHTRGLIESYQLREVKN